MGYRLEVPETITYHELLRQNVISCSSVLIRRETGNIQIGQQMEGRGHDIQGIPFFGIEPGSVLLLFLLVCVQEHEEVPCDCPCRKKQMALPRINGEKTRTDSGMGRIGSCIRQCMKMLVQWLLLPPFYYVYSRKGIDRNLAVFADAHNDTLPFSMEKMRSEMVGRGFQIVECIGDYSRKRLVSAEATARILKRSGGGWRESRSCRSGWRWDTLRCIP